MRSTRNITTAPTRAALCLALLVAGSADAALTTTFSNGVLTVTSDDDDTINIECGLPIPRAPTDNILINGILLPGAQLCNQLTGLVINGGPGNNIVRLQNMAASDFVALTSVTVNGAGGNDTINGSFVADVVTGGPGADTSILADGNDVNIWNPGDGTDVFEGGNDTDRQVVNGGAAAEVFTTAAGLAPVEVRFDRVSPGPFGVDMTDVETLEVNALDGDDSFSAEGLAAGLISLVINGGLGNDTLVGSSGIDVIDGGDGNDTIDANPGNDTITLGLGDDTNTWNNGDNTDAVQGGDGNDRQVVNGAAAGDVFTVAAGTAPVTVRFDRTNLVPFGIDLTNVETLAMNGLDGDDNISAEGLAAGLIRLEISGGLANDTLVGSSGIDFIDGGDGNDVVDANPGNDTIVLGTGDDRNTWNNGDNTDQVSGGDGADTQVVNGAGAGDVFDIAPAGQGTRGVSGFLFRRTNLVPFDVNADGVETLTVNGLDGADTVTTVGLPGVVQNLDGGVPTTFPGDALTVTGFVGDLSTTPVVTLPGAGNITHVNFEFAPAVAGEPRSVPVLGVLGYLALLFGILVISARTVIRR